MRRAVAFASLLCMAAQSASAGGFGDDLPPRERALLDADVAYVRTLPDSVVSMDAGNLTAWCQAMAKSLPGGMCGYFEPAAMNEWQARLREKYGPPGVDRERYKFCKDSGMDARGKDCAEWAGPARDQRPPQNVCTPGEDFHDGCIPKLCAQGEDSRDGCVQ